MTVNLNASFDSKSESEVLNAIANILCKTRENDFQVSGSRIIEYTEDDSIIWSIAFSHVSNNVLEVTLTC